MNTLSIKNAKGVTRFLLMMILFSNTLLISSHLNAQGFNTISLLTPQISVKNTGEKPQSKVWEYDGKWWSVFPISTGTYVWRLDGLVWTNTLKISSSTTIKADCKVIDNVCHILLWRKEDSPSQLVSVEYVPTTGNYKLWSKRTATSYITLDAGVETATIDIDNNGRMWLASDGTTDVRVRWSDSPYNTWSAPTIIETGITDDDISAVISLPVENKIAVLWSNQNSKLFGFKTHITGTDPTLWSDDEHPASQSALNVGAGMSDDHLHMTKASDGTLYCAVKTGYDTPGYPRISLLKRSTSGAWDDLYEVSQTGTRPIAILNESIGKLKIIYTSHEDGGDILYRESSLDPISFGPAFTLISGMYNNPTSTKNGYESDIVILASNDTQIVGALATDISGTTPIPDAPILLAPDNLATNVSTNPVLSWNPSMYATSYHIQVSTTADFATTFLDNSITGSSASVSGLTVGATYFWRVQAVNSVGISPWSSIWSFNTLSQPPTAPVLSSPANLATGIASNPTLRWIASTGATSYHLQVSTGSDFSLLTVDQNNISTTSLTISNLAPGTLYFWRVLASNLAGDSNWSTVWSFTTLYVPQSAPVLNSPANLSINISINPTLQWNAVLYATSYRLQVSTNSGFTNLFLDRNAITATSSQISGLANSTTYYWRTLATNAMGSSTWSEVWSFTTIAMAPPALVGNWKMDEGSGTQVTDASVFANTGITKGSPLWTTGISGSALKLSGSGQYVAIPDAESLDAVQGLTLSMWIRPEKRASQHLIQKGSSTTVDGYELTLLSSGKISFQVNQYSSSTYKINSKKLYPSDGITWMHIAATYNGTVAKLFVNGVEDKSATFSTPAYIQVNDMPVTLGAKNDGKSSLKGTMDEARIYNYALTASEILALTNTLASTRTSAIPEASLQIGESTLAATEFSIRLYPNPAKDVIYIESSGLQDGTWVSISLTDAQGNNCYRNSFKIENNLLELNLTELNIDAGLHFLLFKSTENSTSVKFLIK